MIWACNCVRCVPIRISPVAVSLAAEHGRRGGVDKEVVGSRVLLVGDGRIEGLAGMGPRGGCGRNAGERRRRDILRRQLRTRVEVSCVYTDVVP